MMGVLPFSWSVTRTLFPQMGNWYDKGIFVAPGRSATLSMILPMRGRRTPQFPSQPVRKEGTDAHQGRVKLCLNSEWRKREGEIIGGWYKALISADNENKAMGDTSRGLVRETVMERSEVFFPHTRKYGDVMYVAPARDSGADDLFTVNVRESVNVIEKMLRKGS